MQIKPTDLSRAAELLDERHHGAEVVDRADDAPQRPDETVPLGAHDEREERPQLRVGHEEVRVEVGRDVVTVLGDLVPRLLQPGGVHGCCSPGGIARLRLG